MSLLDLLSPPALDESGDDPTRPKKPSQSVDPFADLAKPATSAQIPGGVSLSRNDDPFADLAPSHAAISKSPIALAPRDETSQLGTARDRAQHAAAPGSETDAERMLAERPKPAPAAPSSESNESSEPGPFAAQVEALFKPAPAKGPLAQQDATVTPATAPAPVVDHTDPVLGTIATVGSAPFAHPAETIASMAAAIPEAIKVLGRPNAGENQPLVRPGTDEIDEFATGAAPVSGKARAIAGAQAATAALAPELQGGVASALEPFLGEAGAELAGGVVAGAAPGAAFMPDHPIVGGVFGGLLGGLHTVAGYEPSAVPEPANLADHPDRLLGPQRKAPTATTVLGDRVPVESAQAEPDFDVTQNTVKQAVADAKRGRGAAPATKATDPFADLAPKTEAPVAPPAIAQLHDAVNAAVGDQAAKQAATDAAKFFDQARTPGGARRPIARVSDQGLIDELLDIDQKRAEAMPQSAYEWHDDENFHSTADGRAVMSATRPGGKGPSLQAKALQNLAAYQRITDEVLAELGNRGHSMDDVMAMMAQRQRARERQGIDRDTPRADDTLESLYGIAAPSDERLTPYDTPSIIEERARARQSPESIADQSPARNAWRQQMQAAVNGNGAGTKHWQAYLYIGPPGAGKSTFLEAARSQSQPIIYDSDPIKQAAGDFDEAQGQPRRPEASYFRDATQIRNGALDAMLAQGRGDDLAFPTVGDNKGTVDLADKLHQAGYQIHVIYVDVPLEEAARRAAQRWTEGGHAVDPHYILTKVGTRPAEGYAALKSHPGVVDYARFDNNVPRGSAPKLVEAGEGPAFRAAQAGVDGFGRSALGGRAGSGGAGGEAVPGARGAGRGAGTEPADIHAAELPGVGAAGGAERAGQSEAAEATEALAHDDPFADLAPDAFDFPFGENAGNAPALDEMRGRGVSGDEDVMSPMARSGDAGEHPVRLSGLHNLSPENLIAADRLGGLPAPSLAVVPEHQPFTQYGSITLIAKPSAFDPARNPVFDADAYSGRAPERVYKKARMKDAQALVDRIKGASKVVDDHTYDYGVWDELVNRGKPDEAERQMLRSDGAKLTFLREHGIDVAPIMRKATLRHPHLSDSPSMRAFFEKNGVDHGARPGDAYWAGLSNAAREALDAWVKRHANAEVSADELRTLYGHKLFDDDGQLAFGYGDGVMGDHAKLDRDVVDHGATSDAIDAALKPHRAAFERWVSDLIDPFRTHPLVKVGGRAKPWTLENVTEAAIRGRKIVGAEDTMTHGPGKVRAIGATRFSDIEHARNAAQHQIKTPEEVKAATDALGKEAESWRDALLQHYGDPQRNEFGRVWEGFDQMHVALSRYVASRGRVSMARALSAAGFRGVPRDLVDESVAMARKIMEAPTDYFEAKPQRAVTFDEIGGAVIPKSAPKAVRDILDRRGIPYQEYEGEQDGPARHEAVRSLREALHSDDDPLMMMRTNEGRAGMGVNRERLADTMSANVYQGGLAQVIVKEAIQNAIDAIRPLGKGQIHVSINEKQRRITVSDEGVGMPPDVATGAFLDAFESEKPEGASGGLGIAKAALFRYAEPFRMTTVAEVPVEQPSRGLFGFGRSHDTTRKVQTTVEGTGRDWINGDLRVRETEVPSQTPTGTTYEVTIDPALKGEQVGFFGARHFLNQLQRNSKLDGIAFHVEDRGAPSYASAANTSSEVPSTPVARATVPGANVDLYFSAEPAARSFAGYTTVHVLNNGYHQFSEQMPFGPNPPEVWVDLHPSVPVTDPAYPFTIDRSKLKSSVRNAIENEFKKHSNVAEGNQIDALVRAFAQAPTIAGGGRVIATDPSVSRELAEQIAGRPYVRGIAAWWESAGQSIVDAVGRTRPLTQPSFEGIGLGGGYLAVNIRRDAIRRRAKELGVSVSGDERNAILLNPFAMVLEARAEAERMANGDAQYAEIADDPTYYADKTWGALVHEIAHQNARGHDETFAGEYTRIDSRAARVQAQHLPALDALWRDLLNDRTFQEDVAALDAAWKAKRDDRFKGYSGHDKLDRQLNEESDARGAPVSGRARHGDDDGDDLLAFARPGEGGARGGIPGGHPVPAGSRRGAGQSARGGAAAGGAGSGGGGGPVAPPGHGSPPPNNPNGPVGSSASFSTQHSHPTPDATGLEHDRPLLRPRELKFWIQRIFNPESLGPAAKATAGTIRHRNAERFRRLVQAQEALKDFGKAVGKLSKQDAVAYWDAAERGQSTGNPTFDAGNKELERVTKQRTDQLIALDRLKAEAAIEHYIGRFWSNPANLNSGKLQNFLAAIRGKRPLEGPKSFLKHRSLEHFTDGLDAGLIPATYNYVDAQLAKIAEMERLIAAEHMLRAEKKAGRAKPVMGGQDIPLDADGDPWVPIGDERDPAFQVYGPSHGAVSVPAGSGVDPNDVRVYGRRSMGRWYAPKNSAAIWNNYLSKGLRGNPLFDAYMAPAQAATQIILGFSGFHAVNMAVQGMASDAALGVDALANDGDLPAAVKSIAKTPAAAAHLARLGYRVMQEYRKAGTNPELADVLHGMIKGGFVGTERSEFWTGQRLDRFKRSLHDALHAEAKGRRFWGAAKTPINAIYAGIEQLSAPILAHYVPLMKAGATYELAARELAKLPANAPLEEVHRVMGDVVKEMDMRFGQVQYDNHFMHNVVKHLAQGIFMAPGWTFGTATLAGRGVLDVAKLPKRAFKKGQRQWRQYKGQPVPPGTPEPLIGKSAAFWLGAVALHMLVSAVLTKLMTGDDPHGKDFFFPRIGTKDVDGNENRYSLPGYVTHDVYGYGADPKALVQNKLSPVLAFMARAWENRDFYGNLLYDDTQPFPEEAKELGQSAAKELGTPLSVQNYLEAKQRGQTETRDKVLNAAGVSPAKKSVVRSPAQNLLYQFLARQGHDALTPDQVQAQQDREDVFRDLATGDRSPSDVVQLERAGELTPREAKSMFQRLETNHLVTAFQRLRDVNEAEQVFDRGTDEERALWWPALVKMRVRYAKQHQLHAGALP